jgi:hypothetical protein
VKAGRVPGRSHKINDRHLNRIRLMSSAFRYTKLTGRSAWAVLAAALIACLLFAVAYFRLPSLLPAGPGVEATPSDWAAVVPLHQCTWSVFQTTDGKTEPEAGPLSQRFRLAGTLVWLDPDGTEIKKAILADLQARTEEIVSEGTLVGSIEVVRIRRESVLLRDRVGGQEEELILTYARPTPEPDQNDPPAVSAPEGLELGEGELVISTNRFGAQVGATRWVMSRVSVMGFVDEMSEHPARVAKLFDSMKPVYEGDGPTRQVSGYVLQLEGEGDFYRDVGLKEGDIVRRVNNLPMQSQQRAIFWIDQFRANNANAFQIDVERDGKAVRLEYLVR